jgi:arylsulfatase A-like enzyme
MGRAPAEVSLSPRMALVLAAWFGLAGGYLDLGAVLARRELFFPNSYYAYGRFFPWTIPTVILAVMMVPGLVVAVVNRWRPGTVSPRGAAGLFATLGVWDVLLRLALYPAATLLLAAGISRWVSLPVKAGPAAFLDFTRRSLPALLGLLVLLAALSTGRQAVLEARASATLPPAPVGAGNAIVIVLDAVRAQSLSLYGYPRATTPKLARWAEKGVRFDWAVAPAVWTFPSHSSFFTGRWTYQIDTQFRHVLDAPTPTLAEYLAARGYLTAGFVANTTYCSYETKLDRGFVHYEDYPLTAWAALWTTGLGYRLIMDLGLPRDPYQQKWIRYQGRDAAAINRAFLDWLARRPADRPFFAFLNYFDAHEPFVLPEGHPAHFGLQPATAADQRLLLNYWYLDKRALRPRDVELVRDRHDDCIAFLDRQIDALLCELDRRGLMRNTTIIITSDHGEALGEHGLFNHGYSLYRPEVRVPLMILAPTVPAGWVVAEPVSLRDLPATVVDLLGLADRSPLPGRSLAAHWRPAGGPDPPMTSPALSEAVVPTVVPPSYGWGKTQRGFAMSLVAGDWHYLRDSLGGEELYHLRDDPGERKNLIQTETAAPMLRRLRGALLQVLSDDPVPGGAEADYLKRYRLRLESQIGDSPVAPIARTAR